MLKLRRVNRLAARECVRGWYEEAYPTDRLGRDFPADVTFWDCADSLNSGRGIYRLLGGAVDSVVRGRIFTKLAEIFGVERDSVYLLWMNGMVG